MTLECLIRRFFSVKILCKKKTKQKTKQKNRTFFPKWLFSIYSNGPIQFWHPQPMVAQSIWRGTWFKEKNIESTLPEDSFTHKFHIVGPGKYAYILNYLHLKESVFLHFDTLDFFFTKRCFVPSLIEISSRVLKIYQKCK